MPRLRQDIVLRIHKLHPDALRGCGHTYWNLKPPPFARQIRQLWKAIEEWETGKDKSIGNLLEILTKYKPDNPELRLGDTAKLWAARYYFLRIRKQWSIRQVDKKGLCYYLNGEPVGTNYHIYYESDLSAGYIYFKYGVDWDEEDIVAILSGIRMYHESLLLKQSNTEFTYYNLLIDKSFTLRDKDFDNWIKHFIPLARIMSEESDAQRLH